MFVSRCRIPTVFRHFSPTLFAFSVVLSLFYVSSFLSLLSQSFVFLLTSLVYICLSMSYSHCISSILTDFVCYFCRSLSFLLQFFPNFVFLCRSFSFLRHYCIFVFRCCFPTIFRQFSPFLLAFSVILSLSYISIFDSLFCLSFLLFPTSLLCICLSMSYSHCLSSILSDFVCLFCESFPFFVILCRSFSLLHRCLLLSLSHYISSILSDSVCFFCRSFSFFVSSFFSLLSQSFFLLLTSLLCICLSMSYSHCISPILSDFVCLFCRSLFFLRQFFPYFVFLCRCFPFLRHCCVFVCRCFPTLYRQFFPSLFAFYVILSLSYVSPFHSLLSQSFFLLLTSLLSICLSMSYSHCISSILTDFVCYFCRSLSFLGQFFPYFVFLCRSFPFLRHCCIFVFGCCFPIAFRQFSPILLPIFPTL